MLCVCECVQNITLLMVAHVTLMTAQEVPLVSEVVSQVC